MALGSWFSRLHELPAESYEADIDEDSKALSPDGSGRRLKRIRNRPTATLRTKDVEADVTAEELAAKESKNEIKYKTCSWYKTAALLFSEYICLAIMSFPWSYGYLGLIPGLICTVVVALFVLYTSLVVWEFCLRHPEIQDVCDLGQMLFWGKKWAWYFTAIMFLLNNTFIQGLHVLIGSRYLNTISNHATCTVAFAVITVIISFISSLPRTFDTLAKLATASAIFTFISVILATAFLAVEGKPAFYSDDPSVMVVATGFNAGPIAFHIGTPSSTTFVTGMTAFLNISYTFIGQITLPSFIAEMKEPRDFPKALWAVTIAEIIVFSIVGGVSYAYTGSNYVTAPAFGSISNEVYKKVSFSFMIPTLIFLGVLYASVSARFIFFSIFKTGNRHKDSNTVLGWSVWALILLVLWIIAFIVAEVIPFFSDLLSLMSSLFDSFFGFIFWGLAWFRMRSADYGPGWIRRARVKTWIMLLFNVFLIMMGLLFLTAGTYATVQSIIDGYAAASFTNRPFSCADNSL